MDGRLVIALVFVVGGAGVALAGVQPEASLTPTQALGQGSGEVRVKGVVADVDRVNDTFVLEDDEHELTVQMADVPVPVTPGKSLLAEGHLVQMSSTTVMQAEEIQMGCPSKYQS